MTVFFGLAGSGITGSKMNPETREMVAKGSQEIFKRLNELAPGLVGIISHEGCGWATGVCGLLEEEVEAVTKELAEQHNLSYLGHVRQNQPVETTDRQIIIGCMDEAMIIEEAIDFSRSVHEHHHQADGIILVEGGITDEQKKQVLQETGWGNAFVIATDPFVSQELVDFQVEIARGIMHNPQLPVVKKQFKNY